MNLRVTMISLGVTDMARAVRFYSETLGMELAGKPGEVTIFRAGDVMIALNAPLGRSAGKAMVGAVEVIFGAESVSASHRELQERGCGFVATPHEVTTGLWAATFVDPDGHRLTVLGGR
jgi:predicted enzyme related to lactoylglutathione lyase